MKEEDPLGSTIREKAQEINEEGQLKKKRNRVNSLVILTSLLLLSGVLVGLVRIILSMMS